jgi:hypothetical protein
MWLLGEIGKGRNKKRSHINCVFGTGCEFLDGKIEILFWKQATRSIQAKNSGKLSNHIKG